VVAQSIIPAAMNLDAGFIATVNDQFS